MRAPPDISNDLRNRITESLHLLRAALLEGRMGRIAVVSSFGSESGVLLHLIAQVEPNVPILFIDTRMLFAETLAYKTQLENHLGLGNVRTISPSGDAIRRKDIWGRLHKSDPDACCGFRKTQVLDDTLGAFDGWITGRKRFQALTRSDLKLVETTASGKTRLNPLADWRSQDVEEYAEAFDLPQHPLKPLGYHSIGCASCTSPVMAGEDPRAGRWRGMGKTECGIHIEGGTIVRQRHAEGG